MYLLDTNVLSELRRPERADARVSAWAGRTDPASLYLSVITLLELEMGVLAVERCDAAQGRALRGWLDTRVVPAFATRILPIDTEVARRCAALHVPDRRAERDALIAATALVHRLTVVTRNEQDFRPTGASVFNPWTAG